MEEGFGNPCSAMGSRLRRALAASFVALTLVGGGCGGLGLGGGKRRPRTFGEVPANRLAYRLETDFAKDKLPPALQKDEAASPLQTVAADFKTRRKDDALLATVPSPDGHRALALYATGTTPEGEYRIDLYSSDGTFIRNVLPANLSGAFPQSVAWSPDGSGIAFIGRGSLNARPTPTPADEFSINDNPPSPDASALPFIAPVQAFNTEQLYVADRDGNNIKPLTAREGLIYFALAWSPDARALSALACREDEWTAAANNSKTPQGRPRIVNLDGRERLLDDRLTGAVPAWSPDATKVATAFETDVVIYDASGETQTAATLPLSETLLPASIAYDAAQPTTTPSVASSSNKSGKNAANVNPTPVLSPTPQPASTNATPISFNPVVRLEWLAPESLLVETAFVRVYNGALPISKYARWHIIHLSPQASLLSQVSSPELTILAASFATHL